MAIYVAFLRGINITKYKRVKMEDLRRAFENMGFGNVRTILASGNVIFETPRTDLTALERKIEKTLPEAVGFSSDTFVLSIESLQKLAKINPFENVSTTTRAKPFVTFIKDNAEEGSEYPIKGKEYSIVGVYDRAVCSVVDLTRGSTSDLMRELDKRWKVNTTRGWSTIEGILK